MTEVTTGVPCSANCSDNDLDTDFWQEKGGHILMGYVHPVIIFVGIIGNFVTLAVVCSKQFRKSPSSLIIGALTLTDTALLLMGLHFWLYNENFARMADGDTACKAHAFFSHFLHYQSPALLVILTVERATSVFFPLKCREICSRRRILLSIISAIVLLALASIFTVFAAEIEGEFCTINPKYLHFWLNVWFWIDSSLALFLPFTLIFIGNILIVTKLYTSREKLSLGARSSSKRTSSVTMMLIAVSAGFLVLNLPKGVYFIGYFALDIWSIETLEDYWDRSFLYFFMTVSVYLNSAINFIMYCLTGSKFRRALKDLFAACACKYKMHTKTSKSSTIYSISKSVDTATTCVASKDTKTQL